MGSNTTIPPEPNCTVDVRMQRRTTAGSDMIEVVIEDNGSGVPPQERVVLENEIKTQLRLNTVAENQRFELDYWDGSANPTSRSKPNGIGL